MTGWPAVWNSLALPRKGLVIEDQVGDIDAQWPLLCNESGSEEAE